MYLSVLDQLEPSVCASCQLAYPLIDKQGFNQLFGLWIFQR
jgi:hypothetical protein